jgi:hypothetical protein
MTTCEPSQPTLFGETELPSTASPEGSHAKTFQARANRQELLKGHEAVFGQKSLGSLANYDRRSSSWRTSQISLVALATGRADGLDEFSETWPSSGTMRNGKTYQRQPWALPIAANASGLLPTPVKYDATPGGPNNHYKGLGWHGKHFWPTPAACMAKGSSPAALTRKDGRDRSNDRLDHAVMALDGGALNPMWVEWLMGFPIGHTDLQPLETP